MLGVNAIVNVLLLDGCEEFKKASQSASEQISIVFLHNLLFSTFHVKKWDKTLYQIVGTCVAHISCGLNLKPVI